MASNPGICIFTETYYPVVGGGETQARLLAEGLVKNGFPVIVLTRRSSPSLSSVERYGEITVYRLPPIGSQHLRKWGLLFSSFPALFRWRGQYDMILVSGFRVIGIAAVLMSKLLGKACFLKSDNNGEMSGDFFMGGLSRAGLRANSLAFKVFLSLRNRLLRRADGFIAISSQIEEEYLRNRIEPPSRIHRIPNTVDTRLFHPVSDQEKGILRGKLGLPCEQTLVVYTGRLVSYKGLPPLLRAWNGLSKKHANTRLLLVGGGSADIYNCEDELRRYVLSNGLEKSVFFCGEVHRVYEYIQACDIFVFPTEKEAFGISLIEAMACGLPAVSTSVGGIRDYMIDGENGLVVNPGDEQEIYRALDVLLSDKALAETLGETAVQTVQARFSIDVVVEKYMELFISLLSERSSQR